MGMFALCLLPYTLNEIATFGDSPVNFAYSGSCTMYIDGFIQLCCLADQGSPSVMQHLVSVESSSLLLHSTRGSQVIFEQTVGSICIEVQI